MSAGLPLTPTYVDGLLLAVNAVPDTQLVIDCANCGCDKFSVVAMNHDLHSDMIRWDGTQRACFSDLRANDLVLGTEDKLRECVTDAVRSRRPSLVLLLQSSAVQLVGTDIDAIAAELEEELGVPMAVVPPRTFSGDFAEGYATALELMARRVDATAAPQEGEAAAVVGIPFGRSEEDDLGNVRELRRLFGALELDLLCLFPSGDLLRSLRPAFASEKLVALPAGARAAQAIAERTGARVVHVPLPVGLDGTARWLRLVGDAHGRAREAEATISRELGRLVPRLEWVIRHTLAARRAAIVAEPELAQALASYLAELGLEVVLVALQTRDAPPGVARGGALSEVCPPDVEVVVDPFFDRLEADLSRLAAAGDLDIVVGSGRARDAARQSGVAYLEVGYPSYLRHALFDSPWLGFRGAAWLADRIAWLIREADYRRA